jgi:branched-chain amino acid transport system ATP-binding protein
MTGPEFLSVNEVSRHFGGHKAVDGVSLRLRQGALAAVIGPNGAGKTTLFNLIAGALPPTSGQVVFRGARVSGPERASKLGIARTFQNARLFQELSVLENVAIGLGGLSFWRGSLRLPRWVEAERLRLKRAYYLLEDVGLGHLAGQPAGEIAFGQQRLVEFARAMALQPKLLLLDEPAAGLNATETAELGKLIRRIHESGVTILLVEHDMSLVMGLAERVIVLDRGQQLADGAPSEVRANPAVCAAYLGGTPGQGDADHAVARASCPRAPGGTPDQGETGHA